MPVSNEPAFNVFEEGDRLMTICNACRYCEGYCAVFPAMEQRTVFAANDLRFLANLCHNCGECLYACQYAPPHQFGVNVPKLLAEIRVESYQRFAWPGVLAGSFRNSAVVVSLVLAFCLSVAVVSFGGVVTSPGDFYSVISHNEMVAIFGSVSALVVVTQLIGLTRYWRESAKRVSGLSMAALAEAISDVLRLRYLSSDGAGCTYPSEHHSQARRWFHHFTFYGFGLCFASTSVAAVYHYAVHWVAPYGYFSLPVVLGTAGGLGLLVGPAGLYLLKRRRDRALGDETQVGMDVAFIAMLFLTSLTGLLLLALRETPAMSALLGVHLGVVIALFVTMPYGKFVHGIYRFAALVQHAAEQSQSK